MALLWILSSFLFCATSSATNGLHDSVAAFQSAMTVRTAGASQLQRAAPQDPVNGLSAAEDQPEPKDELGGDENATKGEKRRELTIDYTIKQKEPGLKMEVGLDSGCGSELDGERKCKFNNADKNNSFHVFFDLAEEVDDRSIVTVNISVRALLLASAATSVRCPVCGHRCEYGLFGFTGAFEMPPCPWKVDRHDFAFAKMPAIARIPWGTTVNGSIEAVRPNGNVILAGTLHLER
mmetsp:Transcript_1490/g.4098  ORF Transcript_1490/g.4098 Transcript_1490/m.4098 type:complete len:236 (-) Transcript_1490:31-738(-)